MCVESGRFLRFETVLKLLTCVSADQRKADLEEISKAKLLSRILMAEGAYTRGEYKSYDDLPRK